MQGNEILSPDFRGVIFVINKIKGILVPFYETYLAKIIEPFLPMVGVMANILIVIFLAGIIYVIVKSRRLRKIDAELYKPIEVKAEEVNANKRQWDIILRHLNSQNSAEWKIAIMEADNILDEILKEIGYVGDTLSDRLKSAGDSDSVQKAWEAHKVRNEIAHGADTEITQHEAKRVIALYESVFKRFGYF